MLHFDEKEIKSKVLSRLTKWIQLIVNVFDIFFYRIEVGSKLNKEVDG